MSTASATPEDLFAFLDSLGIAHRTVSHEAVFTVDESRDLRDDLPGAHTKNLFLKDKKGRIFLVTCEERAQVNLKALEKQLGSARVSFGKPELLAETLGVKPGSVTALALINDRDQPHRVHFAIDRTLTESELVNCHPLHNEATTAMSSGDLMRFVAACGHSAQIVDFAAPEAS